MLRLYFLAFMVCLISVFESDKATAEMVVIASSAPEISGGQIIADGSTLSVPAGASVTLISADGVSQTIQGPYSGIPGGNSGDGAGDTSLVSSLSGLLSATGKKSTSLGVMRSGVAKNPDDPWAVNIDRSGKQCVRGDKSSVLWRSSTDEATRVKIKNMASKEQSETEWPAGAETMSWPDGPAINDGDKYLVRIKGSRTAKKITLFIVPSDLASIAHEAIWMAEKGCFLQAKLLLTTIK